MLWNILIVSYRSLMNNKLFLSINILGLSIALACCIVGYFCYDFNTSFDSIHKNSSVIYRVNSWREFQNEKVRHGYVPLGLGNAVAQTVPDVKTVIRYASRGANFREGQDLFSVDAKFADSSFFQAFTFNFIQGNGSLADKSNIVIGESLARRLFGEEPALGRSVDQVLGDGKFKTFIVSGVFQNPPFNSSFSGELYSNFYNHNFDNEPDWNEDNWKYRCGLFLVIPDATRLPAIVSHLNRFTENNNQARKDFIISEFELDPFRGMAVRDEKTGTLQWYTRSGFPQELIAVIAVIGTFILLITCFNLINTFIAISSKRLKEIGIRKVIGGTRKNLINQFMGETLVICIIALVLGVFIANYFLIPSFNELWPHLRLSPVYFDKPGPSIFMVAMVSVTALLAGSYPALYISKFHPVEILKGKLTLGRNRTVTHSLLALQFALSLVSLICSLAFIDNSRFQSQFDYGFDKSGLVFTEVESQSEFELYKNALIQNPDIISIAGSRHHISEHGYHTTIKWGSNENETDMMDVGDDYLNTVGLELVEGRDFINGSESDRAGSVIVTEGTVKEFGWERPIGMEIAIGDTIRLTVIGVVKNFYREGLWHKLEPMIFRKASKEATSYITASTDALKLEEINRFMGNEWKRLFPDRLYDGRTIANGISESNRVNTNMIKMSTFLGIVALLLTVTGLFTLVSLNINGRMKEIGVRKVMGASAANLSWILNREFGLVILLASLAGSVLGAITAQSLISDLWKYYQPITAITLFASLAVLLIASVVSTAQKIYNTTRLNPSDILRNE